MTWSNRLAIYALIHGIGAFIISGGLEFAIAYGMYAHSSDPVTLWKFPNTFSGDCAVTIFVQCVVTWFIEELLISIDVWNRSWILAPLLPPIETDNNQKERESNDTSGANSPNSSTDVESPVKPWKSARYWARWFIEKPGYTGKTGNSPMPWLPGCEQLKIRGFDRKIMFRGHQVFFWLFNKAVRALLIGCCMFFVVWPVTMGIMTAPGHKISSRDYSYGRYPTPQIAKLIFGGVLGLLATPIMAYIIVYRDLKMAAAT